MSVLTKRNKLEEFAELVGQHTDEVVVEQQFPQVHHLPELGRQTPQLVGGEIEVHEVLQATDVLGHALQVVVVDVQAGQVLQLP